MSNVQTLTVASSDDNIRIDRWFKKHFPQISHGRLQKWLRTGQVRLDGGRVKAASRVREGQSVRVPPLPDSDGPAPKRSERSREVAPETSKALRESILYRDDDVIVINKPAGLAVQGGSGVKEHLDGYLDALRLGAPERPRLVHRLDKETSGVLLLARTAQASRWLTAAFRGRDARKLYWAVVAGVPQPEEGIIDAPLDKRGGAGMEKMRVVERGEGQKAQSVYRRIVSAGRVASWVAMEPLTGRTHQLRVHAAEVLGTPIIGDGKYGGEGAFIDSDQVAKGMHLHARAIRVPAPGGRIIEAEAPLPAHMVATFAFFGFQTAEAEPGFLDYAG